MIRPIVVGIILSICPPILQAKNLGVMGHVFPISEIDMLDWIDNRLRTFEQNGELDVMKNQMQIQVKESVERPPPVQGLTPTNNPKTFFIDPTLTLAKDIKDNQGRVLYKAGTAINAMDSRTWPQLEKKHIPQFHFSKELILFDADDTKQRLWAMSYRTEKSVKWILTQGEPGKMAHLLDNKVYFDQGGNISRYFELKHIPVVISQEGTRWKVKEVDVSIFKEE
ncbi:type-F conjugative transfer system protein TraW [Photobacterium sp. R1]